MERARRTDVWAERAEDVQLRQLRRLLSEAAATDMGRKYAFRELLNMNAREVLGAYASRVPLIDYEDIRIDVERMMRGEKDVLWPGRCRWYAQSSGTSGGKSKYVPVTDASLRLNHYPGAAEAVASYLALNPASRIFSGKGFILGGSFANELADVPPGVTVGDLSANLIDAINPLANLFRVPDKKTALLSDWAVKLPALVGASLHQNISNISGVPSWFLTVLRGVISAAGATTIHDVWPGLEVFFHGGIAFGPYREQYRAITDPARMHYIETYNASEGFFAVQDSPDPSAGMLLLLDHGVFYEFRTLDGATVVPAWDVEPGQTYALVISSCNGLWRYLPGDTVRVESVEPLRISIAGRTNSFINAFGEELMVWNADTALAAACAATGARVADYTAAPVYAADGRRGRHQWLIEFATPPGERLGDFARGLDEALQRENSDYQAKRAGGIFLDRLTVTTARHGLFDDWLESTGKLGGQRKVPRLSNSRQTIDSMLKFNESKS